MDANLLEQLHKTKSAAQILANTSLQSRNAILTSLITSLEGKKEKILEENSKDIEYAVSIGKNEAFINRLTLNDVNFETMIKQVKIVIGLEDVINQVIETKALDNSIVLNKVSVSLGVIGIIYESRPNVTIDAAALCIKSGNAVVLKGGSESINTNRILVSCIKEAFEQNGIDTNAVAFIDSTDRKTVQELLKQHEYIDVLIPRGGYDLVKTVVEQSTIPVLYHAEGGARIYIDESADISKAVAICVNAKTSRPATCNSIDTIVVHKAIAVAFLKALQNELVKTSVEIRGDEETCKIISVSIANEQDYRTEFLDYILSIKIVNNLEEAITFIQTHSKGHSEGVVAEDYNVVKHFTSAIDAAAIFVNCSTRLHDGSEFGMGAEMGIATGKLHARGPVGLKELTTYKWIAYGNGQIR